MELERFLFDAPKTCFNSVTGKKIADNVVAMSLFANQACYCFLENDSDVLFDANGHKIAEDINLLDVERTMYVVENDDETVSMLSNDGRVLFDKMQNIVFSPNGWFVVLAKDGTRALYRPDLTLAAKGFLQSSVMQNGECFFVEYEPQKWTAYAADGTVLAQNVKEFQFLSPTFYILSFEDKTVVYDDEKQTQFVCEASLPQLMFGHMLKAVSQGNLQLYRADGARLLDNARGFEVLSNGLVWANPYAKDDCLYGRSLKPILVRFGLCCADNCGYLFRGDKDYLFDEKGRHITTYPLNSTMACGSGYYIALDGKKDVVVLHRPDASVLAANLVGAIVYPNHWKVLFYSGNDEHVGARAHGLPRCTLLDDKDNVIVENADVLAYLYYFGAYVFAKDGKYSLLNAKGEVIEEGADVICVFGDVYVVQREGQMMEVHFLANIDA